MGYFLDSIDDLINDLEEKIYSRSTKWDEIRAKVASGELVQEFLDFVTNDAINEKEGKVITYNWVLEVLSIEADFRISEVYVTGSSQVFKTLGLSLLNMFLVCKYGFNTIWAFPQETMQNRLVKVQHKKIFGYNRKLLNKPKTPGESNDLSLIQVDNGNAYFTHINQNTNKESAAEAQAGAVAVSAEVVFIEEASQYRNGSDKTLDRRLDASRLGVPVRRKLGTPGNGMGIELDIEKCQYYFYPSTICRECKKVVYLHPYQCLLKPFDKELEGTNVKVKSYFTDTLKIVDWFTHDNRTLENRINNSYIGCPHCEATIYGHQRENSKLRCIKTGILYTDLIEKIKLGEVDSVAINIPSVVKSSQQEAKLIIKSGVDYQNPVDFIQQRLGQPSTVSVTQISARDILECYNNTIPENYVRICRLAGIDQGRGAVYLGFVSFWLPEELIGSSDIKLMYETAIREVEFLAPTNQQDMLDLMERFKINGGLIDNEPNITVAANYAYKLGLALVDQVHTFKGDYHLGSVEDLAELYDCYKINSNPYGFNVISNWCLHKVVVHPDIILDPEDRQESSWTRNITSVKWDTAEGKVERPKDKIDDLFFALVFTEAAFKIWLSEGNFGFESATSEEWVTNLVDNLSTVLH